MPFSNTLVTTATCARQMWCLVGRVRQCLDKAMRARIALSFSMVLVLVRLLLIVTPFTSCRRGWRVSQWQSLSASCLRLTWSYRRLRVSCHRQRAGWGVRSESAIRVVCRRSRPVPLCGCTRQACSCPPIWLRHRKWHGIREGLMCVLVRPRPRFAGRRSVGYAQSTLPQRIQLSVSLCSLLSSLCLLSICLTFDVLMSDVHAHVWLKTQTLKTECHFIKKVPNKR